MNKNRYCKRLIEVDLPIKRISEHARREKSIRHGHISTLHIWWARRPLAACRAVLCASLWPDPADDLCPQSFREDAVKIICEFANKVRTDTKLGTELCSNTWTRWNRTTEVTFKKNDIGAWADLRYALLDFIADFANWDASTIPAFLEAARALTQSAHEALGGEKGTKPLVIDPFAGGGAIPFEALRIGSDVISSDLNPIATLINKVIVEDIPKNGNELLKNITKWGEVIKARAKEKLSGLYPSASDGTVTVAYLWARTIKCEGPGCGAQIPLLKSLLIAKRKTSSVALKLLVDKKNKALKIEIVNDAKINEVKDGTIKRGTVTCPCCGYSTAVSSVRKQLKTRNGGAKDSLLYCVVKRKNGQQIYSPPSEKDIKAIIKSNELYENTKKDGGFPNEELPAEGALGFRVQKYGITKWSDLYTARQLLAMNCFANIISSVINGNASLNPEILLFCIGKLAQNMSSVTRWRSDVERSEGAFGMQTLQMVWDYSEVNPIYEEYPTQHIYMISETMSHIMASFQNKSGKAFQQDATVQYLPDDSFDMLFTDPPYYDAISYADLSDYFYVWMKRAIGKAPNNLFKERLTPKTRQAIMNPLDKDEKGLCKDENYYENMMRMAFLNSRISLKPNGIGLIVFAHKSTEGWEKLINAVINAGWIITGSWPIDTEMTSRMRAMESAALVSSVHLVCRPRENSDGSLRADDIGDWREMLEELPKRMHEWMPRLAKEGVVGADAIFACLGPALEIFSKYSHVEKPNGEKVTLKEYLEHVWAAVSKEALNTIFEADTAGFEEDARLTAIWLWTLFANANETKLNGESESEDEVDESESKKTKQTAGYVLEYDTARKIAQGLGVNLDKADTLVQIHKDKAILLSVEDRARYLFDIKEDRKMTSEKRTKKPDQMGLFGSGGKEDTEREKEEINLIKKASSTLDKLHQCMLLFANGKGLLLKNMIVEDGLGKNQNFWKLAQALSALYPKSSDEKRWVDGVLAKKKSFGF